MAFTLYYHAEKRGLAEKIRVFFAETGMQYIDSPVDQKTFEAMQADGRIGFGTLPALRYNSGAGAIYITDSANILEEIAKIADANNIGPNGNKYMGAPGELTSIRAIAQFTSNFQLKAKCWLGKDNAPADFLSTTLPTFFTQLEKILEKNDDGDPKTDDFTFGKMFTFADVSVFEAINAVVNVWGVGKIRQYTKVKSFHDLAGSRKPIQAYITARPENRT
jgi:hypothetical protein